MVMNIAAIWLRVTVEASSPMPVAMTLNTTAASSNARKLPVTGTPKTVTASRLIDRKFSRPRAT